MTIVRKIWKLFVRASEIGKESDWHVSQRVLINFIFTDNVPILCFFLLKWAATGLVPMDFRYVLFSRPSSIISFLPFSPHKSGTRIAFYIICRVNLIGGVMVKSAHLKCGRMLVWALVESKQTIKLAFLASLLSKQH